MILISESERKKDRVGWHTHRNIYTHLYTYEKAQLCRVLLYSVYRLCLGTLPFRVEGNWGLFPRLFIHPKRESEHIGLRMKQFKLIVAKMELLKVINKKVDIIIQHKINSHIPHYIIITSPSWEWRCAGWHWMTGDARYTFQPWWWKCAMCRREQKRWWRCPRLHCRFVAGRFLTGFRLPQIHVC